MAMTINTEDSYHIAARRRWTPADYGTFRDLRHTSCSINERVTYARTPTYGAGRARSRRGQ